METTELQYPNEEKFKNNLVSYLQEHGLVDEMLPDAIDIEGKWMEIAQAYLPDGTREFSAYPTVSLGWMMYVGMLLPSIGMKIGNYIIKWKTSILIFVTALIMTTWTTIFVRKSYFSQPKIING